MTVKFFQGKWLCFVRFWPKATPGGSQKSGHRASVYSGNLTKVAREAVLSDGYANDGSVDKTAE